MPEKIKVGAAQIATVPEAIETNLEIHLDFIGQARSAGCDLVVFPELSLTGYVLSDDSFRIARTRHSKVVREIAEASAGITTQFGFIEEGPAAQFYNVLWPCVTAR